MPHAHDPIIRRAEPADYPQMLDLFESLDAIHRDGAPWMFEVPASQPRPESFFAELISGPNSVILVADVGVLVGFAQGLMRSAPDFPVFVRQQWGVLDGLYVRPEWRRRGVGRLLARSIEEWALGLEAAWVELNVYDFNADAREFYSALGYLPLSAKLRKPRPGAA